MNKEFKVLSLKEEQQLSKEELREYYKEFREYVLNRELTNTTPFATVIGPLLKKPVVKVADKLVSFRNVSDAFMGCSSYASTYGNIFSSFYYNGRLRLLT